MRRQRQTIGALARMWFAVTPQERALLFGILAVALIGLTARYVRQRAAAPDDRPVDPIEEMLP
jgi:hypothetical protein